MSILFITCSRLGDAILSTGVLETARRALPEAPVVVACGPIAAPLFEDWPHLEQIIEIHRKPFSAHWALLWRQTIARRWDWVIDIRGSALSYLLRAQKRLVWRSSSSPIHHVEKLGQAFGFSDPPLPTLHVSSVRREHLQNLLPGHRPVIAVAPVASWRGKEWPQENFIALLQRLTSSQGLFPEGLVAVFAAPSERDRVRPLLEGLPQDRILDFVGKLELLDIFTLLQSCAFFVGNDSGLMHMAAASGVPTLGLFGPSPDIHYAPYSPKASYVRTLEDDKTLMRRFRATHDHDLMRSLSVERVEEALWGLWQRVQGDRP